MQVSQFLLNLFNACGCCSQFKVTDVCAELYQNWILLHKVLSTRRQKCVKNATLKFPKEISAKLKVLIGLLPRIFPTFINFSHLHILVPRSLQLTLLLLGLTKLAGTGLHLQPCFFRLCTRLHGYFFLVKRVDRSQFQLFNLCFFLLVC